MGLKEIVKIFAAMEEMTQDLEFVAISMRCLMLASIASVATQYRQTKSVIRSVSHILVGCRLERVCILICAAENPTVKTSQDIRSVSASSLSRLPSHSNTTSDICTEFTFCIQ